MKRLNFTLDGETVDLLSRLAEAYYGGNKSQTVRAALESLASHIGHEGWVVKGYVPAVAPENAECHSCGTAQRDGEILYRPVFERGASASALPAIPTEDWLECPTCVNSHGEA